jgi:hypothetical protein
MARTVYVRRRGCGCLTGFMALVIAGALWTYVFTGVGRFVAIYLATVFVVYKAVRIVQRRRSAKVKKVAAAPAGPRDWKPTEDRNA